MYEALTAMVCNQLLWGFAHILYLTTLRSNIPPCQKATTLILIPLDNPSFHLGKSSKNLWALLYFCLGRLLKSVTVTSFSQLHLSRNYGSSWSLDQINLHFLALHNHNIYPVSVVLPVMLQLPVDGVQQNTINDSSSGIGSPDYKPAWIGHWSWFWKLVTLFFYFIPI